MQQHLGRCDYCRAEPATRLTSVGTRTAGRACEACYREVMTEARALDFARYHLADARAAVLLPCCVCRKRWATRYVGGETDERALACDSCV